MDRYTSENSYINKEKGSNKFFIDEASVIFPRIYQESFFFSTDMYPVFHLKLYKIYK